MQNLQTFNFQSNAVRVETIDDDFWFCLSDVCDVLNIQNSRRVAAEMLNAKGVRKTYTPTNGGKQEVTFINEPNLYRVIFRSNKAEAVKFQDWVFEEVLPQIRQTGAYAVPQTIDTAQQQKIRAAVSRNTHLTRRSYQAVYRDLYAYFEVARYQDLPVETFTTAMHWLGSPVDSVTGEVLDPEPQITAWEKQAAELSNLRHRAKNLAYHVVWLSTFWKLYGKGICNLNPTLGCRIMDRFKDGAMVAGFLLGETEYRETSDTALEYLLKR